MIARKRMFASVVVALILVALLASVAGAQTFWQRMDNVLVKSLYSTGALEVEGVSTFGGAVNASDDAVIAGSMTVSGTSNLVGNTTVAGTFSVNGASLSVAKTINVTRQGAIAVTEGAIITPTGTFQELTAAGGVTATLADPAAAGQTLILFNSTSNAITIADGSGRYFAGNLVLAAYDNATLISTSQGSWMEIGRSDN